MAGVEIHVHSQERWNGCLLSQEKVYFWIDYSETMKHVLSPFGRKRFSMTSAYRYQKRTVQLNLWLVHRLKHCEMSADIYINVAMEEVSLNASKYPHPRIITYSVVQAEKIK
jgi:hypothetical protein